MSGTTHALATLYIRAFVLSFVVCYSNVATPYSFSLSPWTYGRVALYSYSLGYLLSHIW
jgi:hypothetical protein